MLRFSCCHYFWIYECLELGILKFTCGRAGGVMLWILVVGEARLGREGGSTNGGIKPGGRNDESLGTRILTTSKICFIWKFTKQSASLSFSLYYLFCCKRLYFRPSLTLLRSGGGREQKGFPPKLLNNSGKN